MFFLAAAVAASAIAGASAQQSVAGAAPTPAPNYDNSYTKEMPYTWMTSEGYKSVDCGYGYNKDESQRCSKADWVRRNLPAWHVMAHYLHSLLLSYSIISKAATQRRLSSKVYLFTASDPPTPRASHSHY